MRLLMNFGDVVRTLRVANDWTQADLGSRVGYTRQWVAMLESGILPTPEQIDRFALAFGVPREVLTGDLSLELLARKALSMEASPLVLA